VASTAGTTSPAGTAGADADPTTTTFTVVGDSLTAGLDAPIEGTEVTSPTSWVPSAVGPTVDFVGGWAVPGAPTADMLAGARPETADVLVLMGGTNDLRTGVGWSDTRRHLLGVVDTVGVSHVLLCAVPAWQPDPEESVALDEHLEKLAAREGWTFLDPWAEVDVDGSWTAGASADGVHPVAAVAAEVGRQIGAALAAGR
jgi:hypothetical protein